MEVKKSNTVAYHVMLTEEEAVAIHGILLPIAKDITRNRYEHLENFVMALDSVLPDNQGF